MTSSLSEVFSWVMSRFKFFHYGHHICWQSPEHTTFSIIQHHSASFSIIQHISQPTAWACEASEASGYATGDPVAFGDPRWHWLWRWTGLPCANSRKKSWEQICFSCFGLLDDLKMIVEISWKIWLKVSRSFENRKDMNGCHIATFLHMQIFWNPRSLDPPTLMEAEACKFLTCQGCKICKARPLGCTRRKRLKRLEHQFNDSTWLKVPHCWHSASYTSKWPHSSVDPVDPVGPVGTTGLRVSSCFVSFSQFLAVSNVYCLRHHTLRQLVHHASESPGEVGNWTKFRSGALAVGWAVLSTTIAGTVSTCTVLPKVV